MIIEYEDNEINRVADKIINSAHILMKDLIEQLGRKALDNSIYKAAAEAASSALAIKIPARYIFSKDELKPMAYLPGT